MNKIDLILEKYSFAQRENLIPILQDIQDEIGYLSEEAIVKVGKFLNMPTSKIFGLATFYNKFRFFAKAKYHIRICNGASCHANSNKLVINELYKQLSITNGEITKDGLFSVEETTCLSACGFGPVLSVNDKFYTNLSVHKVSEIVQYYKNLEE